MSKRFNTGLSGSGFRKVAKGIRQYRNELTDKCYEFAEKLADKGVQIAQLKISSSGAVESGELMESMSLEPGDLMTDGARFIIYTGCQWAAYIEFGTGLIGSQNPHPDPSLANWKYDVNLHGEKGWYYHKDGEWHWTKGMMSRPFMYETGKEIATMVAEVAREVFGSD